MKQAVVGLLVLVVGCGAPTGEAPDTPPAPPAAATSPAPAPEAAASPFPSSGMAFVRALDLDGNPIADLVPIVTTEQNALKPPIATGLKTGVDGIGSVPIPPGELVYVRAWDPALRLFPNNVYSVTLKAGEQSTVMDVQMIASGTVAGAFFGPDESPLTTTEVRLMVEHPSQGPWWLARSTSDADGVVVFESIPAGRYILHLHDLNGHTKEMADIEVQPEGITKLGRVVLQ